MTTSRSSLIDLSDVGALRDDEIDLARTALRIAMIEYPGLDPVLWVTRLDALADRARRHAEAEESEALLDALDAVLFVEEGFHGNVASYYDPRNSFLNDVLERRTGIPITLSVVYIEVARRLGVRVDGVGFPGHFLVAHVAEAGLELIDPFNRGARVDAAGCRRLLEAATGAPGPLRPEMLRVVSRRQILVRMLRNLKAIYGQGGDIARAVAVLDRILQIAPGETDELRDRGLLRHQLGDANGALRDLDAYVRIAPAGEDLDTVHRTIAAARRSMARWN
jgi:regulator of sirC expression with transglutaminase-like and TPR domain